jgi:protein-S-isoprenylcysteine O-methyltransferase Ste14
MGRLLALITIMVWPVIPLFWIPVHCATPAFRRMGLLTYVVPLVTWVPVAAVIYGSRDVLLAYAVEIPLVLRVTGTVLLLTGTLLHLWTARLLGLRGITGMLEVSTAENSTLVTDGIFSVVRHPTYLAHTVMFLGVFLTTGFLAVGALTLLDLVIVNTIIIPLEERELLARFGADYEAYRKRVSRIMPRFARKTG